MPDPTESTTLRATQFFLGDDELAVISFEPMGSPIDKRLSAAEQKVASLVLQGLSSAEVAAQRGTAERTVANQLASLFRKLGITSRSELASALER